MTETAVREYHTIDKMPWGYGEWLYEPDKLQWRDKATGLDCLIKRNPHSGILCGYVGVPPGHRFYNVSYDDVEGEGPDVHGGLTYSASCQEGPEESTICHVPDPGEPDDVWWLGFDCGHAWDLMPAYIARFEADGLTMGNHGESYKPIGYVRAQCEQLAVWLTEHA